MVSALCVDYQQPCFLNICISHWKACWLTTTVECETSHLESINLSLNEKLPQDRTGSSQAVLLIVQYKPTIQTHFLHERKFFLNQTLSLTNSSAVSHKPWQNRSFSIPYKTVWWKTTSDSLCCTVSSHSLPSHTINPFCLWIETMWENRIRAKKSIYNHKNKQTNRTKWQGQSVYWSPPLCI